MKTERTNMGGDRNNKGWKAQQRQEELRKTERTNGRGGWGWGQKQYGEEGPARAGGTGEDRKDQQGRDRNNKRRRAQQKAGGAGEDRKDQQGGETETIRGGGPNKGRRSW